MKTFKAYIKKILPFSERFGCLYRKITNHYYIWITKKEHRIKLKDLKGKDSIKCVILAFGSTGFRERLYELLMRNNRFEVTVVVCPVFNQNQEYRERRLSEDYRYFKNKGFKNIVLGYDVKTKQSLDIKKTFNPDIVIYTNPYRSLIGEQNYITKFCDTLTVYIPYYINNTVEYEMAYNELMHNIVWRYYVETEWHKKLSVKYSTNHSRNVVVTGYPGLDMLLDKNYKPSYNAWKIKDPSLKRIIWAPHQTINPNHTMYYSAFLLIADQMTELARKYKDKVQIAFKPHPFLVINLYKEWGKDRTDAFYDNWRSMENTTIVDGDYIDLFLTSDAIIHDSASFITEYLMLNKPALRTNNGRDLRSQFNEFSIACLEHYYMAYNAHDVEQFIKNVINNFDPKREERTKFVHELLIQQGNNLPSENIVNDILDSIDNQVLYRN